MKTFEKILEMEPDNLRAIRKLALSRLHRDQPDQAIRIFEEYIAAYPQNANAYFHMGNLYQKLDRPKKALEHFEITAGKEGATDIVLLKLASLQAKDDFKKAEQTLLRGLETLPDNIAITEMLAQLYLEQKAYAQVAESFRRLKEHLQKKYPGNIQTKIDFYHIISSQHAGQTNNVVEALVRAIDDTPPLSRPLCSIRFAKK